MAHPVGNESSIQTFLENLIQEVITQSEVEDEEKLREDQFTDIIIQRLVEVEELDDGELCYHRSHGVQVNGYYMSDDGDRLDLFVSACSLSGQVEMLPKGDIDSSFKRVRSFLEKSLDSYHIRLEESSDAFGLAYQIYDCRNRLARVRLFLFSDQISRMTEIPNSSLGDIEISYHIWDLERLFRSDTSGRSREAIQVDFEKLFGTPLACLPAPITSNSYKCYFAVIPGRMLVELYSQYGPRLLERNVRCFLQARGNVNKGIRQTINAEPDMFLAYNNGLSATAEDIELDRMEDGTVGIRKLTDFQIINGGQTTGSIYNSFRKDHTSVEHVYVPMKLTVLTTHQAVDEVAPRIARYANSQNKVNTADFSANHQFHVKVEELSRTIWAPAQEGMQRQTRWFYERSRGQYLDDKGREDTKAKKKSYEAQNPTHQKFTKVDLAKFENTWAQHPHFVSRGAQKNFAEFMLMLEKRGKFLPDEVYFRHLVAKAILFRRTEKIVSEQKFGGYRANIVTYTLAYISNKTAQRLDLDRIWKEQGLSPALSNFIAKICKQVHKHIIEPPNGQNVTEWCKKEICWKKFKEKEITIPRELEVELITVAKAAKAIVDKGIEEVNDEEKALIEEIKNVPANAWFAISKWAKETQNLQGWQRSLAFSLGRLVANGGDPSRKQAIQGKKILEEVERLGFKIPEAE